MTSPFNQSLPRMANSIIYKYIWTAERTGKKDHNPRVRIIASKDYIWMNNISIPVDWVDEINSVGPGFSISWINQISNKREIVYFCVRSFFGYNTKTRDELINKFQTLTKCSPNESKVLTTSEGTCKPLSESIKAKNQVPNEAVTKDSANSVKSEKNHGICQECNNSNTHILDFFTFYNIVYSYKYETKREVLCAKHLKSRYKTLLLLNALFGSLGLPGIFTSPFVVYKQGIEGKRMGLLSMKYCCFSVFISCLPLVLILGMILLPIMKRL